MFQGVQRQVGQVAEIDRFGLAVAVDMGVARRQVGHDGQNSLRGQWAFFDRVVQQNGLKLRAG